MELVMPRQNATAAAAPKIAMVPSTRMQRKTHGQHQQRRMVC